MPISSCNYSPFFPYSVKQAKVFDCVSRMQDPERATLARWLSEEFDINEAHSYAIIDDLVVKNLLLYEGSRIVINRMNEEAVDAADRFTNNQFRDLFHKHNKQYFQHGLLPFKFKTDKGDSYGHLYFRCVFDSNLFPELKDMEIEQVYIGTFDNRILRGHKGTRTMESLPWREYEPPREVEAWIYDRCIEVNMEKATYALKGGQSCQS